MKKLLVILMVTLLACQYSMAAERKLFKNIDQNEFISETHVIVNETNGDHIAIAWWLPQEFYRMTFSQDTMTSESDKRIMIDALKRNSLLAVVQADIAPSGEASFYSKEEIKKNMYINFSNADGNKRQLLPLEKINSDLEIILATFNPVFEAAMGPLGDNFHFYVLTDESESSTRLIDPYKKGDIHVQLSKRDNVRLSADITLPLNSLFIPRKCPNGEDAHISWNYCPWTGKRLEKTAPSN